MHSNTTTDGLNYSHNGDFSGDITLELPAVAVEVDGSDSDLFFVSVPFKDLADIVAEAVRNERMARLEDTPTGQLLGLSKLDD